MTSKRLFTLPYLGLLFGILAGGNGVLFPPLRAAQTSNSSPAPIDVLVDGKPLAPAPTGFQIPAAHKSVSIRLGSPAGLSEVESRRMRYKLEGVDHGWRQVASETCLIVRFADAAGDQVGQRILPVDGTSAGWRSNIESSTFTGRRETVRVPADSTFVTVAISSSGPPTAMGVYVVQGLKILRNGPDRAEVIHETTSGAARQDSVPQGWVRSGTRPSMAKMVRAGSGDAFCILDDDPSAHAEWILSRAAAPRVQPGELLTVEWSEMYNIGMGNRFDVSYGRLNAGAYRFWSDELDATGNSLAGPRGLEFVVLKPIWKSGWFWISGSAVTGLLLWLGCRAIIRTRIRQHLARVEQEHMIERERLRIARDLHDDLGARLTHISLMSGLAENDPQSASARESFQRISGMARELVAALYQTVWTVNPEHDHLEALVNYICQLTQNLSETARIRCRIHSCEAPSQRRVTSEVRHNVTLGVKEALHNAIKHSGATEITVRMEFNDPRLIITVADNGRGFDAATVTPGCGLANMRRRMHMLGGALSIESSPNAGTEVSFEVPISTTDAGRPAISPANVSR